MVFFVCVCVCLHVCKSTTVVKITGFKEINKKLLSASLVCQTLPEGCVNFGMVSFDV